jgi:hypothetical protein
MLESDAQQLESQIEFYLKSNQPELIRQMAFTFLGSERRELAAQCFKSLKDSNSADIHARVMYVQTTLTNNQQSYAAARDEFLAILREYPGLLTENSDFALSVVRSAAHTCVWTNDVDKAKELLEDLVKRSQSANDFDVLKHVYGGMGDLKGELWAMKEMVRLDKDTFGTLENLKKIDELQTFIDKEKNRKKLSIQRYPNLNQLRQKLEEVIEAHVLQQDINEYRLPSGQEPIALFMGGCWHRDLGHCFEAASAKHYFLPIAEQINSPAATLGFMEWLTNPDTHYFKNHAHAYLPKHENAASLREKFATANIIILTYTRAYELIDLSNSRVAYDEISIFTIKALAEKYQYKLATVDENVRSIVSAIGLLRKINASANIILQIHPAPIFATTGNESSICNDYLSKALLRVSINEVINNWKLDKVIYWPTIEIFRWISSHQTDYFGGDDGSAWHISLGQTDEMVRAMIKTFTGRAA